MKGFRTIGCPGRLTLLGCALLGALASPAYSATLTVMQNEAPRSMDPGNQTATFTATVLDPMYEGLLKMSPALKLEPALATSWSSDASGLVWTFTLRSGVTFHDGTPFNADAVVSNFARHLDVKRGLAASGRLRTFIDSVTKVDDRTVVFKLKKPYPAFLNLLTTGACLMVSPTADKAGTLDSKAVGTGPYKMVQYKTGEYVLEEKNPGYWGKSDGPEDIKWTWSSESSVMNMALQAGEADVINPVPPQFARMLKNNPKFVLHESPGASVFWVALNTQLKPLDDVRVRQALNFATDRDGLVRAIMSGFATPANSPLAPITPGYDKSLNPYPLNIEKAKALLKEAGYANGFSMSIAVQGADARIGQVLQSMWAKIGVKLDVRQMESGVWTKAAFADPAGKKADGTGAILASWSSGVSGADLQLRPLYYSGSFAPTGANLGFFSDAKLDKLLDTAASTLDENARNQLYVQAQQEINLQAPQVLLYYQNDLYATGANISNVWMIPGGNVIVKDAHKQ
ncbi:ABC transporter substrate-binding protein [Rouxiella badensis]|jgi:glutathione transport system substrate-binding protein|uniref:Glycosyl transferase n=1 Tax=Rouxiella badensis TaxID=1646377 RepID=A0A1X0WG63_9GAMM|nr:ABC transporter substrate-binding protein [Rouxiella badensis]MCC3704779.1 ABC transporter substrate-binding protein [Rouxiella badensis]MCC3720975.1 ABC transporter substrate-binding protein [Rouxiella badensis]MCC3729576.1 ABC transporter substrate-binding protein [Rouxiella badensis]MCC3735397.1 ABC transporter substrate-binding protein [Rouxiella badensis]MCC3741244.1 ABC transporter substrate-binding protein [Rouxiella badensis]